MTTKLRPPVKWHGGKFYLAKRIIETFPEHHTYVEPFGGAASVLLNKAPSPVEVYNDLDTRLTRLFRVIRDHGEEFSRRLALTPYSEIEFDNALEPHEDEIEQARQDFIRWRLSLGGRGDSFSLTLHRVRRDMADVVSGYLSAIDSQLPLIIERLRKVQIVCRPALDVIQKWDRDDTLFYCDPPYAHGDRVSPDVYRHEMSDVDHAELAAALRACKGTSVISGYPGLYSELYSDWRCIEIDIANHAAQGGAKKRMRECLWIST